jgi:phospholipase C
MSWTGFNWTNRHPRLVADLTGDGRADIVGFGGDGVWVSLNVRGDGMMQIPRRTYSDFGAEVGSWSIDRHLRLLADLTGDGRADIVGFGDDGVYAALGNGDGTFRWAAGSGNFGYGQGWRIDQHPRFVADITGDGRPDVVGFGNDGVFVGLSNGDGTFQPSQFVLADFAPNAHDWHADKHPRLLADLTGDGRADIVGFGYDDVYVALSNGDGSFQQPMWGYGDLTYNHGWRIDQHPRFVVDLTGDGRADLVGFGGNGVYVALGNGDGTFRWAPGGGDFGLDQGWRVDRHPRFLADVTGDGRPDVVGFGDDGVFVSLSNGDGTYQPMVGRVAAFGYNHGWRIDRHPRFLADMTGDGRADIVGIADDGVYVALSNGDGTFQPVQFALADYSATSTVSELRHIFVLMLENRSFDHMLGHSGITGTDAETGQPTTIDGLTGTESNSFHGITYPVTTDAPYRMAHDPGHSFDAQLIQLCGYIDGHRPTYPPGGPYPPIDNSGFATSYGLSDHDPANVMRCFTEDQLPFLHQLAREFVVCDRWFASHPGHTWPNRIFVHAATSGGMDMQPSWQQIANWSLNHWAGLELAHGTIYDRLEDAGLGKSFYSDDSWPMVATLHGISNTFDVRNFRDFETDLHRGVIGTGSIHIEPNYEWLYHFDHGNSQHPTSDIRWGDLLIKRTYEAIRNSPLWEHSMLIITWDECGGFYDHVAPPATVPPGDPKADEVANHHQFAFDQLGPRVPAVVISPLIPKNLVDHRVYDHASVPATIERAFGLAPLTARDQHANSLTTLVSLGQPRQDTPTQLVVPDNYEFPDAPRVDRDPASLTGPVDDEALPGFVFSAVVQDFELRDPSEYPAIQAKVASIKTRREAAMYVWDVAARMEARRAATT